MPTLHGLKNSVGSIYTLSDPRTKEIRYIGQTIQFLERRLDDHIRIDPAFTSKLSEWVKSLLLDGVEPEIDLVWMYESEDELNEGEKFWIRFGKLAGLDLVNSTAGGSRRMSSHYKKTFVDGKWLCFKCETFKVESDFHSKNDGNRKRRCETWCKECVKNHKDRYSCLYDDLCLGCLKHNQLQSNGLCKKCNKIKGLRECKKCNKLLMDRLNFYSQRRVCIPCYNNSRKIS